MSQGQEHIYIFSTNPEAARQYEEDQNFGPQVVSRVFTFSEHAHLDKQKLVEAIKKNPEVQVSALVLLLATGKSSYLWFEPAHNPRNLELCSILKDKLDGRINFVVCPTTPSAQATWDSWGEENKIFRPWIPSGEEVKEWHGFNPNRRPDPSVNEGSVVSLIPDGQHQVATVHTGWQTCSGDSCHLGGVVKRIFMLLACLLMCYLPFSYYALAERQRILDRENKAIALQRKENEDESERLRQETESLSKEKHKLAQENQALSERRRSLDVENKAIVSQRKENEDETERLSQETESLSKEKQKLAQENQALSERRRSLDVENKGIASQRNSTEDESKRLRAEKGQLGKEMQKKLRGQRKEKEQLGIENQSKTRHHALNRKIGDGRAILGLLLIAFAFTELWPWRQPRWAGTPDMSQHLCPPQEPTNAAQQTPLVEAFQGLLPV